jgi:RNA polymerase sigma-70 factor (ECF subfamily)
LKAPLKREEFDQAYIDRLAAGDPDTEYHFTLYFGQLLTLKLRSRLRSAAAVEDVSQETFARVLKTLKQKGGLATAESLGAFVNGVCNNVLFEQYRAGSRTTPLPDEYDAAEARPSMDAVLIAADDRDKVREALAALPQKDKELLHWLFFEECDKDEICRRLNVDRNHLRVLVHRAKLRFRERFAALSSTVGDVKV